MRVAAVDSALKELLERCAPDIGDRLPAERDIAAQIGCSRQTIRIAFAKMEHAGLIWRHVGKGTFRGPAPLDVPLRETLLIAGATPTHLIRTRLLLEPSIAGEAARRVDALAFNFSREKLKPGGAVQVGRSPNRPIAISTMRLHRSREIRCLSASWAICPARAGRQPGSEHGIEVTEPWRPPSSRTPIAMSTS